MTNKSGFTIVEITVYIMILLVAFTAIGGFIVNNLKLVSMEKNSSENNFWANKAIYHISKELKNANFAMTGDFPIVSALDNEIIFYSDYDNDNTVERIRYFIEDNVLKKGIIEPSKYPYSYDTDSEQVKEYVKNINNNDTNLFSYFDEDYTSSSLSLATPAAINQISIIKVYIRLTETLQENDNNPVELETAINIRNL